MSIILLSILNGQNQFAEGSMKPKVESAIRYLENVRGLRSANSQISNQFGNRGKKAVICSIDQIDKAMDGKAGTVIVA